ncbi:hypothetical protein K450DRAFT_222218 [Umbelopsis ramanniana AG]|uniref:Uncharacterized protein n=1 Tax=Umbelopsis ramanniana AG TaxID=1314678 RepID=A0AAD5HGM2_UMBRA|nr:uncharacterized protein K450DRAFT_222218 [Umbelopsis ramanniana AG]KAI8583667.1 hypothetical protein K450DRAFT_222218 [Umbelopsis ramanniana AG]
MYHLASYPNDLFPYFIPFFKINLRYPITPQVEAHLSSCFTTFSLASFICQNNCKLELQALLLAFNLSLYQLLPLSPFSFFSFPFFFPLWTLISNEEEKRKACS